ncbi:MAG: hypothetical protein OXT67_00055 [Zetaproteobacteria bacterium]|nr:hypothetical protein [Zetaproteobacteria bacterium]
MSRHIWFVVASLLLLAWASLQVSSTEEVSVMTSVPEWVEVTVDGKRLGLFQPSVEELLGGYVEPGAAEGDKIFRFHREFVSKPSLFNWAEVSSKQLLTRHEIVVAEVGGAGKQWRSFRLSGCRPVTWSIAERDIMGSFYEEVVIVAQAVDSI